ncbi:MAG: type II secretion system F family protein [Dethiobacter sp.]|jgi:tight adherence protein B|nr:type II secretion system F family protein [Dethiobacter sp.]
MDAVRITILIFFAAFIGLRAVTSLFGRGKEEIAQRMLTYTRDSSTMQKGEKDEGYKKPSGKIANAFRALTPKKILDKAEQDLMQTDILLRPEELIIIQAAAVVVPAIIALGVLENMSLAIILSAAGAITPTLYLRLAKVRRQKKFNDQLGDAVGIMSNSLRAGFSFLQTLDSLHKETTPPLSVEFGRALREMKLGTPTEEALQNMSKRVKSDDFDLIIVAVNIQRQVGGNLAEILDNIAFTIKERLRIKGEIKTLTAQGRISGIIVGVLPLVLGLFIFFTNPAHVKMLFTHPLGIIMLIAGLVSLLVGIALIRKIVNIEF